MDRLSHFIVVQVFFVFSAILIIVLYPRDNLSTFDNNKQISTVLDNLVNDINTGLKEYRSEPYSKEVDKIIEGILKSSLRSDPDIQYAQLYFKNDSNSLVSYYYQSENADVSVNINHINFDDLDINYVANSGESQLVELGVENNHIIYAYNFKTILGDNAFLIIAVKHSFLLFNRTAFLWAILLLFLGTVLTALLMIYLLSNKFKKPYQRLVLGLEKTASGDMFYQLETESGKEITRLVRATNKLSAMLWDDHKKIEDYSIKLRDASISLKESQTLLGIIIDNSPLGIITADRNGKIMVCNKKASELFGYNKEDVLNKNITILFTNSIDDFIFEQRQNIGENGFEVLGRTKNGDIFPAYIISSPIIDNQNRTIANLFMIRDISESKNFQEMMVRLDCYYIKGKMAGDVAHAMNNYLAILSGNLELMPMFLESGKYDKIKNKLELMRETVDNISRFSERLVDSDPDDIVFRKVNLNQLIENIVAFLKPQKRFRGIKIETTMAEKMPFVEVDEIQIQQALMNIVENAGEAVAELDGHKTIRISTELNTDLDNYIEITIRDNGPGVPKEKLDLLFKKKFTTRIKGRGMGLIACRKIIEGHDGDISYFYDEGAIIRITLPITRNSILIGNSDITESSLSTNV